LPAPGLLPGLLPAPGLLPGLTVFGTAVSLSAIVAVTVWPPSALYLASDDDTAWVMAADRLSPGLSTSSSTADTVTVCAVDQSDGRNTSVSDAPAVPPFLLTFAADGDPDATATDTS